MAEGYRSALALEQAVKAAARKSGQDVGRAVEGFYAGRLLERVFSEERRPLGSSNASPPRTSATAWSSDSSRRTR